MSIDFGSAIVVNGTPNQDAEPPQIAVSGRNVYVIWHEFPTAAATQPDIFFARSTDRGSSFGARTNLSNSAAADSRDEDMAVSDGRIFIVWSEDGASVLLRRSTNNGSGFDPAKKLNVTTGVAHPQIKADGSDVYVVWEAAGQGGNNDIYFVHSSDAGRNFSSEKNISSSPGQSEFPQIALPDDRVVVTWRDDSAAGRGFEIFVAQGR